MSEQCQQPIRRHANGAIDTEFYVRLGRAERGRAVRRQARRVAVWLLGFVRPTDRAAAIYPVIRRDLAA